MKVQTEETRKVTVNLPAKVLDRATKYTGKGVTQTIIEALHELENRAQRSALRSLKGKIEFDLNLDETRR